MTYRSQQAADVQYLRNVDQVSRPGSASPTTRSPRCRDRLRRVRELIVQAQNGAISTDSRAALSAQAARRSATR